MSDMDQSVATIGEHFEDLRQTLIRILAIVFSITAMSVAFHEEVMRLLTWPLQSLGAPVLVILSPSEGFKVTLEACFWFSLVITSPVWFYFVFRFITPALQTSETKLILPVISLTVAFLLLGLGFAYYCTIPFANHYLYSFNKEIGQNMWGLSHYLDYTVFLLFANALAFEMGAILLLLVHYRIISLEALQRRRRPAIVAVFIVAALLTPPDVFTQGLLALPLIALYELIVLYARYRNRTAQGRELLLRIVAMLTKMAQVSSNAS